MSATICDDAWNVHNMQHIIPNLKRWDYSDIPGGGNWKDWRIHPHGWSLPYMTPHENQQTMNQNLLSSEGG